MGALVAACSDLPAPRAPVSPAPLPVPAPPPSTVEITKVPDPDLLKLPNAVPRREPLASRGNPPFYDVYGVRYTVLHEAHGYVERGVASWYGPDFHGLKTSTGEPYDMFGMTAAHKTLPLPCYAEVTNLANGTSVVVRVNDRGPFKANRIIDLSYTAALKLGMLKNGTALVEVRALDPDGPIPKPPTAAPIYAQAGAFSNADNARRLKDRLVAAGFSGVSVFRTEHGSASLYRVRVGPLDGAEAFDALVARLSSEGIARAWLSLPGEAESELH